MSSNILNFPAPIKFVYGGRNYGDFIDSPISDASYMYMDSPLGFIRISADLSICTNMSHMFDSSDVSYIDGLISPSCTNMSYMFHKCGLRTIPHLDTRKVENTSYMFYQCFNLTTIPQLDLSNVFNASYMFYKCSSLTSIPELDCGNIVNMDSFFASEYDSPLPVVDLGGFKDLGKKSNLSGVNRFFLSKLSGLTHESLMNVINNLYDRKSNGLSTLTINFGTTNLDKLTDEEKAIAVNKGWTLS